MSYNVRDAYPALGAATAIEFPNGAGASTIACVQAVEPVTFFAPTATYFVYNATPIFNTFYIAPPSPSTTNALVPLGGNQRVVGASMYYTTKATSASSTFSVEIVPAGTADGSGNAVLSAISLNQTYQTSPFNLAISTSYDNLNIAPNSRINIWATGAATTGLVDFCLTLYIIRTS